MGTLEVEPESEVPDRSAAVGVARLSLDADESHETGRPDLDTPVGSVGLVRLDWTREEVILAMDFYVTCGALGGKSIPGQDSGEIAQLSRLLKTLGAYPPEAQGEKYRNPHCLEI
jgi:hypothetical protein